ncbi:MAG: sulfotransferase [Thalassovita sp.]
MSSVKVFQVGFNKCATRTMAQFFEDNGYPAAHYLSGRLARNIRNCKTAGTKPLERWDDRVLFTDMETVTWDELYEAYKDFAYLDQWYPDAYFILNTRRVEQWLLSRLRHDDGDYLLRYMAGYGDDNPLHALQRWSADWETHLPAVRAHFADRPGKLLEFDIDKDGPDKIVAHFDGVLKLDPEKWGHRGKT